MFHRTIFFVSSELEADFCASSIFITITNVYCSTPRNVSINIKRRNCRKSNTLYRDHCKCNIIWACFNYSPYAFVRTAIAKVKHPRSIAHCCGTVSAFITVLLHNVHRSSSTQPVHKVNLYYIIPKMHCVMVVCGGRKSLMQMKASPVTSERMVMRIAHD